MKPEKEAVDRLQKWILLEAYHRGESRIGKERAAGEFASDGPGDYWIHRDEIYLRFFKLSPDQVRSGAGIGASVRRHREVRLKGAIILCDSVRELLRNRLIRFARVSFSKTDHSDLALNEAGRLFLTEAGVRRARWLLCGFHGPETEHPVDGRCAA